MNLNLITIVERHIEVLLELHIGLMVCLCCRSFSGVCSRLQNALGGLRELVGKSSIPTKNSLAIQLINAIRALNHVRDE